MIIALLFNSDASKYGGCYGPPIHEAVFGTGIIQASCRHMRVSVGDVLVYQNSRTFKDYDEPTKAAYFYHEWSLLHMTRLQATFRTATVYSLVFENMSKEIATKLHQALTPDEAYLGLIAVDYGFGPHLALFRNSMVAKYRLIGSSCWIFDIMSDEDCRDESEVEELQNLGFDNIHWEDRGAHGTIFDDYDTLEHFRQIVEFRRAITPFIKGGEDGAYELAMVLEDLNPRLFNALGAAVMSIKTARHEEHVAQAAVSGRRYLEKLADVLFPASDTPYGGRKVGQDSYKNRLWAYIGDNALESEAKEKLGREVDRLNAEFSAGVHSDREKNRITQALVDVSELTAALLALDPEDARKPYFAHEKRIREFLNEVVLRQSGKAD